jgi:tetratricopeptide (TPR) repeat protein
VIEWGLVWKIVEKPLALIGGPLYDRFMRMRTRTLIRASSGRKISILLARIDGDTANNSYRETVRETLRREFGSTVEIVLWPEALRVADGHEYDAERGADATAQKWLTQKHCDVLIWGREKGKNDKGETVLSLRLTVADLGSRDSESYKLTDTIDLPIEFVSHFGAALVARVVMGAAPAIEASGHYLVPLMRIAAERFEPIVERLNPKFDRDTRGALLFNYALVRFIIGEQTGSNDDLLKAVAAYRQTLKELPRERAPLEWAITQNNLGNALSRLGERESGTAKLEQAVAAYHEALKEFTHERTPLDWAMTQNNLGNALSRLGERESGTATLEQAITPYREALKEFTRERVPLDWAMTQDNLGGALSRLGERESDAARLKQAVAAFHEALEERTRERAPINWAATQNNLGIALRALGAREGDTTLLEQAVAAYREALKERTRERVPLDWASTQINLGNALSTLGERKDDPARLEEAVACYREALKEITRDRVPLDWAKTQNNLGSVLLTLGQCESGTARLEQAVAAYREALEIFQLANASYYIEGTRTNLARAETMLSERRTKCN